MQRQMSYAKPLGTYLENMCTLTTLVLDLNYTYLKN
jgi:hypothetical protein